MTSIVCSPTFAARRFLLLFSRKRRDVCLSTGQLVPLARWEGDDDFDRIVVSWLVTDSCDALTSTRSEWWNPRSRPFHFGFDSLFLPTLSTCLSVSFLFSFRPFRQRMCLLLLLLAVDIDAIASQPVPKELVERASTEWWIVDQSHGPPMGCHPSWLFHSAPAPARPPEVQKNQLEKEKEKSRNIYLFFK